MSSPAAVTPGIRPPAGTDENFSRLWSRHYADVYAYARRRAPADMAAEVTSASFTVLWQRMSDAPTEPLPWLYAVARRQLANQRRAEARRLATLSRLKARLGRHGAGSSDDAADDAVERSSARMALARLRPADREILMLVAWEGLDPEHAANTLGLSVGTFAVRLHRARRRLESQLSAGTARRHGNEVPARTTA